MFKQHRKSFAGNGVIIVLVLWIRKLLEVM
jgi:hypothetical protein